MAPRLTAAPSATIDAGMTAESRSTEPGEDGVADLRLDVRGSATSALKSPLAEALGAQLDALERTVGVRVALLHLEGELGVRTDEHPHTRTRAEAECRAEQAAVERLGVSRVPVVACLSGPVRGVAFEIALACRARVAICDTGVDVGLSDLEIGLAPRLGGLRRVVALVGISAGLDLGTRGDVVDAARAQSLGLIDVIVPASSVRRAALDLAALPPSRPATRTNLFDRIASREPLLRARRDFATGTDVTYPARVAALEILESIAEDRSRSTAAIEARRFGELAFSSAARRLRTLRDAARSLEAGESEKRMSALNGRLLGLGLSYARDAAAAAAPYMGFVRRIFDPLDREARSLVLGGVDPKRVESALADWGLLGDLSLGASSNPSRELPRELIQMRCVLPLVVEALRALEDGALPSPVAGDVASVFLGGFPPFRGGVFRYVDDVGARELAQRLDAFRREHGSRYEPPPLLRRLAAQDGHLHPTSAVEW